MRIASLVSGGVDSSVTIPLLKEQGFEPEIFYIKIGMEDKAGFLDCPSEEDIEIVTWIARKYGCRMEIVDLQDDYWQSVVAYTLDSVKKGLTPNPDVMCNLLIKFGVFNDRYGKNYDRITTGHYASRVERDNKVYLGTARDHVKDQTYFLSRITEAQMSKLMFPLEKMLKKEVRQVADQMRLPSAARRDSQGICFLGKINYAEFIRRYIGERPGKIVELETGKILGQHKGYWFYTIGQRKGLGLGQGPWFVVKKDTAENIIFVSNGYDPIAQYNDTILLEDFSFITENPFLNLELGADIFFKIRHTPEFTPGALFRRNKYFAIKSSLPIAGIAPGQFGVVYDTGKKVCLGSGVIA